MTGAENAGHYVWLCFGIGTAAGDHFLGHAFFQFADPVQILHDIGLHSGAEPFRGQPEADAFVIPDDQLAVICRDRLVAGQCIGISRDDFVADLPEILLVDRTVRGVVDMEDRALV